MKLLGLLLCQRCFSFLPVLPPSSHLKKHQKGFVGISPRLWASSQEETNASEAREAAMQEDKEWYDRFMEEIGNDIDSYAVEASAAMPSKIKIEDREDADDLGVDVIKIGMLHPLTARSFATKAVKWMDHPLLPLLLFPLCLLLVL